MTAYAKPTNIMNPKIAQCYQNAQAIVPADATQIGPFAAVYVGSFGDLTVVMRDDDGTHPVTFKAVAAGTLLPIGIQGVNLTNTSAGNLVGLG